MAEKEYIEREETENRLFQRAEIANSAYIDQTPYQIMMLAQNVVHLIPAADVRPVVKASWIHMPSDGKFRDTCVCSACKKSPPIESWVVQGFNACPYCFADMREES